MKFETIDAIVEPKEPLKFPVLLLDPTDGMVLLAISRGPGSIGYQGIIVKSNRTNGALTIGTHVEHASIECFCEKFVGKIVMSN